MICQNFQLFPFKILAILAGREILLQFYLFPLKSSFSLVKLFYLFFIYLLFFISFISLTSRLKVVHKFYLEYHAERIIKYLN